MNFSWEGDWDEEGHPEGLLIGEVSYERLTPIPGDEQGQSSDDDDEYDDGGSSDGGSSDGGSSGAGEEEDSDGNGGDVAADEELVPLADLALRDKTASPPRR